jgi:hypothetical protein
MFISYSMVYLGDFGTILAFIPEGYRDGVRAWPFRKTTLKRETIPYSV